MIRNHKKLLFLAGVGGLLEFYDFVIYALLASYLSELFFPKRDPLSSLMLTFGVFSIGYLIRPIGGIVFGHFGDKLGRKKPFTFSIFLMAISTFCIGLLPTYQTIGITAPVALTLLRLLQGFSVGGEIPGAITYVSEIIPRQKGLACSVIFGFLIGGIVLASLADGILNTLLTREAILHWGWRIPFIVGGILAIISYFLRKQFQETPLYQTIANTLVELPLKEVLTNHFRGFFSGITFTAIGASMVSLFFLFTPSYLNQLLHYPALDITWSNSTALLINALMLPLVFGKVADRYNAKHWLVALCLLVLLLAYPIFASYIHRWTYLFIPALVSGVLHSVIWALTPSLLVESFPTQIRYSGVAACYNFGFALFAGLAPLIAMSLIRFTHQLVAPSYFLIATVLLTFIGIIVMPHKKYLTS